MRTTTTEQVEPIQEAIELLQVETDDYGLTNVLYTVCMHLEPGLRPDEIGWLCSILMFAMESADVRGYAHLMPRLRGVVDALRTVQSDLQATGV